MSVDSADLTAVSRREKDTEVGWGNMGNPSGVSQGSSTYGIIGMPNSLPSKGCTSISS